MAGSGWEVAAVVVAAAWQGLGGWRGGAGGVVDLFFSCVRPCDHAATISSNSVPQIQFSTVAGYSCSETGTHSANCELIVEFPQVPFLDQSLTCPLLCNATCTVHGCHGRRHPCCPLVLTVQKTIEILQLQYIH